MALRIPFTEIETVGVGTGFSAGELHHLCTVFAGFLLRPGQQRLTDVQAASLRQHHQFLHFPDPGVEIKRELQL